MIKKCNKSHIRKIEPNFLFRYCDKFITDLILLFFQKTKADENLAVSMQKFGFINKQIELS